MKRSRRSAGIQCLRAVLSASLLLASWNVVAETSVDERLLGLPEPELVSAIPGLSKLTKPRHGPHHLRGTWSLARSELGGLEFEATFYFRKNRLERIEHRRRLPESQCKDSYARLVSSLENRYGPGVHSGNFNADQNQTAVWMAESFSVSAYRIQLANQCDLLVALAARVEKDATNL